MRWLPRALATGVLVTRAGLAAATPSPVTVDGVPEQVHPMVPEVGLGNFTMPTGTVSVTPSAGGGTDGASATGSGTASDLSLSGAAYDKMMAQSWGPTAASNAQTVGVNPVALAATCVVESGCTNINGSGSIQGAFQMMGSTYTSAMNAALAAHPELAGTTTSGLAGQNDPATQSIAAAEYLKQAAQSLQSNAGIDNPTVLDVRGSYNFGPGNGAAIATADGSALMTDTVHGLSSSALAANGVTPTTTVQQWRDTVSAKMGTASTQPVLTGA